MPQPAYPATAIGVRDWFGPSCEGTLDLRRDGTFVLAVASREGGRGSLSGTWTWQPGRFPVDGKPVGIDPGDPGMVTLLVGATTGDSQMASWTELGALLTTDCAIYLGTNGVVDLYWGM